MRRKEQGFTLLEAAIAILLFAILLQLLVNFFLNVYINSKNLENKTNLMNSANAVNAMIKEKVREADSVQFVLTDDSKIDPIQDASGNLAIPLGDLKEIRFCSEVSGSTQYTTIKVAPRTGDPKKKGKYVLAYETNSALGGTPTSSSVISDQINSVQVKRNKDSDDVLIKIVYQVETPQKTSKDAVVDSFSVSLAYKKTVS